MNPIMTEIFTKPVGWLVFGGTLIMLGVGLAIRQFVRGEMRKEEQGRR